MPASISNHTFVKKIRDVDTCQLTGSRTNECKVIVWKLNHFFSENFCMNYQSELKMRLVDILYDCFSFTFALLVLLNWLQYMP